jgi:DNA-binding Lrp family transcriptional regulator
MIKKESTKKINKTTKSLITKKDELILKYLVRNPRLSDNALAKLTNIPLNTVNRRRKFFEQHNILNYMIQINHYIDEPTQKGSSELFIVTFKKGITRKHFLDTFTMTPKNEAFFSKHLRTMSLAEKNGHNILLLTIESRKQDDLLEIMNAEIFPFLNKTFGNDAIEQSISYPISNHLRILHNYIPSSNMDKGIMQPSWPDSWIFIK